MGKFTEKCLEKSLSTIETSGNWDSLEEFALCPLVLQGEHKGNCHLRKYLLFSPEHLEKSAVYRGIHSISC
jgi:hypothetical protein